MSKYQTLINILNQIRLEAPARYVRYRPSDSDKEKMINALSRAYIHLFLKVKFGLIDFEEREKLVTDGTDDGGIDAYFIDSESKRIYFIQSKYSVN